MDEVTWAEPDRPLDPVPAQFRIWEVLLFQGVLALLWGPILLKLHRAGSHLAFSPDLLDDAVGFLHALGPALMAFVIRDNKLGVGARFARSGRVALTANALACGCLLLYDYDALGRPSILPQNEFEILPILLVVVPGVLTALIFGVLNDHEADMARPILRRVPLGLAFLQMLSLGANRMIR